MDHNNINGVVTMEADKEGGRVAIRCIYAGSSR